MTFDGSTIDGFSRVQESDVLAMPDAKTFQLLPYLADGAPVARVVCDVVNLDGSPFEGDPRQVLRRALERARGLGFSFFVAPELEYFYFAPPTPAIRTGRRPAPLDRGSYFDLTTNDLASELRRQTVLTLEDMGIPVEYSQHEDAPSQHEIDLRYTDALTMADTVMTVRMVVKEIAARTRRHGHVHAQAAVRGPGLGDAHPHVALRRRHQRLLRRRRRVPPVPGRPPVHRRRAHARPASSPRSPTSGSTPTSGSSSATRRRSTSPGPATTARPWSGCRRPRRASGTRPASSTGPRTRPPTRIWPSPPSWRPA